MKNKFQAEEDHHRDVIINTLFTDIYVVLQKFVSEPNKDHAGQHGAGPL